MNLYDVARRIWVEKLGATACAVLAVVVAILATFHVSLSHGLRPRALQLGVGSVSVLIDLQRSQLSNVAQNSEVFLNLSANYTDLVGTEPVIGPVARSLGVSPSEVGVQTQITEQVPLAQRLPLEPQVGAEILATRRHYFITARNDSGSPIVHIFTQAPTGRQAVTMAAAAARALSGYVANRAREGRIPPGRRVVARQIGPVSGGTLSRGVSRDAAVLIGIATWLLSFIAFCTIKSAAQRSRTRRDPAVSAEA